MAIVNPFEINDSSLKTSRNGKLHCLMGDAHTPKAHSVKKILNMIINFV